MEQTTFNLLEEPWIRVMTEDCVVRECSLKQVLLDSHKYMRLAGELPTQDVAILRLLLAVLHTVFYRVDLDGEEDPIEERGQAIERWQALWNESAFPEKPICEYFETWKDRFWLFHPEYPFYQIPGADVGTSYTAAKLNGELSESSNKIRLFPVRAGENKKSLSYAEAARWLIYLNGFDDTSAKPKGKGLPSPGAGWMGKLGLIYAEGENLFETLMLNLVFLEDGKQLWDEPNPVWEREKPRSAERTEIVIPNNQAELLTLQSRRLHLNRERNRVTGYSLLGGDFFPKINATEEQMTLWEHRTGKKNEPDYEQPKRLNPERQMWRDFSVITGKGTNGRAPGVVTWIASLKNRKILERNFVAKFRTAGVKYGDKDFFVEDILSDHLDFHISLLDETGDQWIALIQEEIERTESAAKCLKNLAVGLYKASGGQPDNKTQDTKKQQAERDYYAAVDIPFRKWLYAIDPSLGDAEELRAERDKMWREEAYRIAMAQGKNMVRSAGTAAFTGRWVEGSCFTTPGEFNKFVWKIRNCLDVKSLKKEAFDEQL